MRFVIFALLFSFLGLIVSLIGMYLSITYKKIKNIEINEIKNNLKTFKNKKFDNNFKEEIDLSDSLSVSEFGNDILGEFSKLSEFMSNAINNDFINDAENHFKRVLNLKSINDKDYDEINFISNYSLNKIKNQVKIIQDNINYFEDKLSYFDKYVKYINNLDNINFSKNNDSYQEQKNITIKSNINVLKNKKIILQKNKIYYLQAISQLKTILSINQSMILNFEEVIVNTLPLLNNKNSMKIINESHFKDLFKSFEKLNSYNNVIIK